MKVVFVDITRIKDLQINTTYSVRPNSLLVFWYSHSTVPPNYTESDILKILIIYFELPNQCNLRHNMKKPA